MWCSDEFRGARAQLCECPTCCCSAAVYKSCSMCTTAVCKECIVGHPALLEHHMMADHLGTIQLCSCKKPCGAGTFCHACARWLSSRQSPGGSRYDAWAYLHSLQAEVAAGKIWWRNIMVEVNRTR